MQAASGRDLKIGLTNSQPYDILIVEREVMAMKYFLVTDKKTKETLTILDQPDDFIPPASDKINFEEIDKDLFEWWRKHGPWFIPQ